MSIFRTGIAHLPLHGGKAPAWLTIRMRKLAREIVDIIIEEQGANTFLKRLADPYWFQAFGCVLAYDWHSSGVTTVLTAVLKQVVTLEEHGMGVCGGKGKTSQKAPEEIAEIGEKLGFQEDQIRALRYASRMTAKVDNSAIQAGYQLYHHAFFFTENENWIVIQQGLSSQNQTARRYHWLSEKIKNFIVDPHNAIVGDLKREKALNMTAKTSEKARRVSVDIAKEPPKKVMRLFKSLRPLNQKSLENWFSKAKSISSYQSLEDLNMPRRINWETMKRTYEFQPRNYEELLGLRGVGPATVRGLALVAELIYGEKPSWSDPVKFSFAFGGKDGVPFPVDLRAMDNSIQVLKQAVLNAKIGDKERTRALKRLRQFVPEEAKS